MTNAIAKNINTVPTFTKTGKVTITKADKMADPENWILNPTSGIYVRLDGPTGKRLAKGEKAEKALTKTQFGIAIVEALRDGRSDSELKELLKDIKLPQSFPKSLGGKSKAKRVKVEGEPKKPSNSYIFFSNSVRQQVKDENPDMPYTCKKGDDTVTITKLISNLWNELEDKSEFTQAAEDDKARYKKELAAFMVENPDYVASSPSPKKPTKANVFTLYAAEHRPILTAENPDLTKQEVNKLIAQNWKEAKKDEDVLEKYQTLAKERNVGHVERLAEYNNLPESVRSPRKRTKSKSPKKLSARQQAMKDDPENFILNPASGIYVKRTGKKGLEIIEALGEDPVEESEESEESDNDEGLLVE